MEGWFFSPVSFYIFIYNLDRDIGGSLTKYSGDIKMEGLDIS